MAIRFSHDITVILIDMGWDDNTLLNLWIFDIF